MYLQRTPRWIGTERAEAEVHSAIGGSGRLNGSVRRTRVAGFSAAPVIILLGKQSPCGPLTSTPQPYTIRPVAICGRIDAANLVPSSDSGDVDAGAGRTAADTQELEQPDHTRLQDEAIVDSMMRRV
jgi:hypothetical protein